MSKILVIIVSLVFSLNSYSACTSPAAAVGTMSYFSDSYYYCNSASNWVIMKADPGSPGATCASPGLLVADKFCNGTNFYSVNSQEAATGTCTNTNEFRFFSGVMNICLSGSWFKTGTCASCQTVCEDMTHQSMCDANSGRCEWNGFMCSTIPTTNPVPPNPES